MTPEQALPVYVINLERQPERWEMQVTQANALGVEINRVDAIDYERDYSETIRTEFDGGIQDGYARTSPGDICCSLSHVRAWHAFLETGAKAMIVLEDDAIVADSFSRFTSASFLELCQRQKLDCTKLEMIPADHPLKRRPLGNKLASFDVGCGNPVGLYRLRSAFICAAAYMITRDAILHLLSKFPHMRTPVDHFLFNPLVGTGYRALRIGFVTPAPVLHAMNIVPSGLEKQRTATKQRQTSLAGRVRTELLATERAWHKLRGARKVDVTYAGEFD